MTVSIATRATVARNLVEFTSLPARAQSDAQLWLDILRAVADAPDKTAAFKEQARRHEFRGRGFSEKSIIRKYYAWRKNPQDMTVLLNRSRLPRKRAEDLGITLPHDFVWWWKMLCERNQRKSKPAYRDFVRRWRNGDDIPGLGTWQERHKKTFGQEPPAGFVPELPRGFTYSNLMRHAPAEFELAAARLGRSAAARFRPQVFTSRVGLEVGQYYVFDDLEHDLKVNVPGVNKVALRPLELAALDLFSGCKFTWGCKPTLIDDDGSKEKLKEREMRFLLAYILTRIGYRAAGTTLCVEHGTAAIRDPIARLLADATDGAIRVERSGIEGAAAIHGYYEGRSKGNFRFKAALESHHNLAHNELAALPGQMGLSRDRAPESLHGMDRVNKALLKACAGLPAERLALIRSPFLLFDQFSDVLTEVYQRINERTDHALEGWEQARLMATEIRSGPDAPWVSHERYLGLPAHEQDALARAAELPGNARVRKLSPKEVWDAGRARLVRLPPTIVPRILGPGLGVERRVGRNALLEFQDRAIGPGIHRYLAVCLTPAGDQLRLAAGDKFTTWVNPFDPQFLHVCRPGDEDGHKGYIGICKRWDAVCRADTEAVHRAMGAAAHQEKELLAGVNARGADLVAQRAEDERHNALVLAGARLTDQEHEIDAAVDAVRIRAADRRAAIGDGAGPDEEEREFSAEEIADLLATDREAY